MPTVAPVCDPRRSRPCETALANLVLLCRRHHRLVHERFAVELVGGRPVFRRADGTVLEDRAPP